MKLDLGDIDLIIKFKVKGQPPLPKLWIRVGRAVRADRTIPTPPSSIVLPESTQRTGILMDLGADQQVPLSVQWTDEMGNPVGTPDGVTYVWAVTDPTIIALTDNGDGTAVATATGTLGAADVNLTATWNDLTLTGTLNIVVVEGLAERINIVPGTPTEATPDS